MDNIHKSTFSSGIDKDMAVDKLQPDFYFDALNMDIVTETGQTSNNLHNVRGNEYSITFPNVPAIYAVIADEDFIATELSDITVDINGTTVTFLGMYETFTNIVAAINADPLFEAMGVRAYTNEESIYNDTPTMYITLESGTLSTFSITATDATFITVIYAPNQTGLNMIGWVKMRDDIIIFSANDFVPNPVNSLGQIWRFSYNKQTLVSTLTLLYNNYINLSSGNPIANPTMVEARYETPSLQNVYWTDNYNPPRTVNVADPSLYSLDPRILNLSTIVSPYIPIPKKINQSGGKLTTGLHYLSYRLSRETGGETAFFLPSYGITIVEADEELSPVYRTIYDNGSATTSVEDFGYWGGDPNDLSMGNATNKSITYKLDAIDTNYTRIELCHIYKKYPTSTPVINIVANEPVVSSSMEFTLTGDEEGIVALTPEEFNNSNETFTRAATMCAKDNYLFLGNVETTASEIVWDARAYRHNASGVAQIIDDIGTTHTIGVDFNMDAVPLDHACINPDDSPFGGNVSFLYKADGVTLGGEGTNISYEFITNEIMLDSGVDVTNPIGFPVRDVEKSTVDYDINSSTPTNQNYPSPTTFKSYHSPYINGFLKGYMRDEIYRFAIVFYDHAHNPMFAKWIADIRMPHVWMPSGPDAWDRTMLFPITNDTADYTATLKLKGYALGVQFTVSNLAGLGTNVSGYSIVRTIRRASDKTVHGQGLYQPAYYEGPSSGRTFLVPNDDNTFGNDVVSPAVGTLYSPEFLFGDPPKFSPQDELDIINIYNSDLVGEMKETGGGSYLPASGAPFTTGVVVKNYTPTGSPSPILSNTLGTTPYTLTDSILKENWWSGGWGPFDMTTTQNIVNHSSEGSGGTWTTTKKTAGNRGFPMDGDFADFPAFVTADTMTNNQKMYVANYRRNLRSGHLSTQYGGNTYSQRAESTYISTNHYQPVSITSQNYVNIVYGGDTFITVMDTWSQFFDDGASGDTYMTARFFPVETTVNTEMRQLRDTTPDARYKHPNRAIYQNSTYHITTEDFYYNYIFSTQNDLKVFFPLPVPYLPQTEFDCRIYNSATPKINGELVDSWRVFKPEDYIEIDTKHGPVNALVTQGNRLFFFQDKAMGIYQTNEKALVQDSTGGEIILGTGGIKQRFDYLSEHIGCRHRFSISQAPSSVFFFDMGNKRPYLIKDGLKEIQGLNGYFQENLLGDILTTDNPYQFKGITSIYDYRYDKYLITFHDQGINDVGDSFINQFTWGLNDKKERFVSEYSFIPRVYFTDKDNLFTSDMIRGQVIDSIYIHNIGAYGQFYNNIYPSSVTFVTNTHPDAEKIFDNLLLNTKVFLNNNHVPNVGFTSMQVYNDYQDTGVKALDNTRARQIKKKWNLAIGGDQGNQRFTERIKSNYAYNKLELDNLNNYELILEGVISKFRINPTMA